VDTNDNPEYSLVLVTVAGNYKPGRVTATVTDLVVPATGLAINIQRTYDSLNAGTSGDFGYGWNLGINVNLTVDPKGNVTFTLGGQRKTFYFTPSPVSWVFPFIFVSFTPEPGLHGTLTDSGPGCADGLDILAGDGFCIDGGPFNPPGYIYTDPNGTSYTIAATGALQSIQDRSGNGLTIAADGITSSTGLKVPFKRDANNRIVEIDDPQGNQYLYTYDTTNGNLATVTYPATPGAATCPGAPASNTSQYTYHTELAFPYNHYYEGGTDGRCNPLPVTAYYDNTSDGGNSALDGRLLSVKDSSTNTTSYAYTLSTTSTINGVSVPNTGVTTITYPQNPADGKGNVATATMIYDSYGDLLQSTDPNNLTTINTYDANHNLTSVTDPLNHKTSYTYDANGNKTSTTYPDTGTNQNRKSTTAYNQYSEPTSTTDELNNVRAFNYDTNYNPQSVTDSLGTLASFFFNADGTLKAGGIGYDVFAQPSMASFFIYDANGNMSSRTDALGRSTIYVYDSLGRKQSMMTPTPTAPLGGPDSTTNYQYDLLGNLTETDAPLGRITNSTYDANGNKASDTDARGNVTYYKYDAMNRLVETDYPSNANTPATKSTKSYDFRNNVVDETDQAKNVTHHEYDLAGRQIKVTRGFNSANSSATSYTYYDDGRKASETDALGHTTSYIYDAAGRLTSVSGVQGTTTYTYDDAGNRASSKDGRGNTTYFKYDARKRLIETDYPNGKSVRNTYDGPGNLASVTDQANNKVEYIYDAANQLKTVKQDNHPDPVYNTNTYGYDPLGNLTALADENQHTTQNIFDVLNEPIQKTLPDTTHTETRNYDAAGNLTSLLHFNGVTTTYTYDALNRLLTRTTPGESPVSFTYTSTGKYLTSTAQDGTVNYYYDALDRLTSKVTPEGSLSYTYFPTGKVETITSSNPHGVSVAYTYDDLNRLSTVVDNGLQGNQTTSYSYDDASNVATVTYPNQLQSTFTYDELNRLTELSTSTSPVSTYTYTLGDTGNRTKVVESNHSRSVNWSYDNINRLTDESISSDAAQNSGSVSYVLDPVGNRTSVNSSFSGFNPIAGSYNADDEQVPSESYDANGNTTHTANGNSYTYDSENHLIKMVNGSTVVTMQYDAFGNRVAKTVTNIAAQTSVTSQYLVEDDVNPTGLPQVVEELTGPIGAGVVTRTYTYGLQRISQNLSTGNNTWTPSFYMYDGGGSVRQLTDYNGTPTDTYEYDAFGNSFTKTGTTPNNYLYRGEQYDSDLGLYYLRARYYNPNTGRFMSRDPLHGYIDKPAALHKYLYAGGDPVNGFDPTGLVTVTKPQGGLGGAIGEWASIIQMISIRAFVIQTVTIPVFMASAEGKAWTLLVITGSSIAIAESCEFIAAANEIAEAMEEAVKGGAFVKGPGMDCNAQPHPYEPPED
jgi:RHS repeat-associated protein